MKYFTQILLVIFLSIYIHICYAQESQSKPIDGSIIDFGIGMGINSPAGKLSERFGTNLNFSLGGNYLTSSNWIYNADFIYLFGDKIKEDVLAPFRTKDGYILGDDRQYADVFQRERGLYLGLGIGKLFPFKSDSRSGLKVVVNGGVLQHNIKFVDERNSVAQLRIGRSVGYDRLTRGFSLKETIAYKHLSKDRRLNFEFAFDFIQGFTSEVRAFNFDTGLATIKSRLDLLFGIRLMWTIPLYRGGEAVVFY